MTRSQLAMATALVACLTLSACSADKGSKGAPSVGRAGGAQPFKDDTDVPLTRQLSQSELTQAIPDAEDVAPGYLPGMDHKSRPGEPDDCAPLDGPAPAGWQRAGRGYYDYQGSTLSRGIRVTVCQFDTAAHAKTAYDRWLDKDETAPAKVPSRVGEESVFLASSGSSATVYGYSRSGTVVVKIVVEDTGGDPTDAFDVLAATVKRLQQVQAGRQATATAAEIAAAEQARR